MSPVDDNVLLLKATSEAAVHTVKDCLALIKLQQVLQCVRVCVWSFTAECPVSVCLPQISQATSGMPGTASQR